MRCHPPGTLARVSAGLTLCRSCGRDTATTEDWRCEHCGQPKPLSAATEAPVPAPFPAPSLWQDLRPQFAAVGLSAALALVGLLAGSELLLIAAAAVLVVAVVTKIVTDGW
jgi:hypothetical protein